MSSGAAGLRQCGASWPPHRLLTAFAMTSQSCRMGRPGRARRSFHLLSIFAAVALASSTALGQSEEELERARVAFQEGDAAEQAGDCKTAVEKFTSALQIKETAQLHLRVGRCQEKLGRFEAAMASYGKGQSLAGSDQALLELSRKMRAGLEPRIPRLTIRMPDAPAGATVTLDGRGYSSFGVDTPLDPGEHVVRAEAPGRAPFEAKLELNESERREVTVDLPPAGATEDPGTAGGGSPGAGSIVMLVLGAGFLGGSIGLAVRGNNLLAEADETAAANGCRLVPDGEQDQAGAVRTCSGSQTAHQEYVDAVSDVNISYGLAAGFGAAAGVSLVIGFTLLGLDMSGGGDSPEKEATPPVSVAPWFGPDGAGIGARGRF